MACRASPPLDTLEPGKPEICTLNLALGRFEEDFSGAKHAGFQFALKAAAWIDTARADLQLFRNMFWTERL